MFWQKVHQLDQQITLEINSWHSAFTDPIWQFFSDKWVWIPMYVAIIAFLIWRLGWKKGLIAVGAAILTFGFCDQFSNLIKDTVGRIRPLHDEFMLANGIHILEKGGGFSFFSAHSANSFGLAAGTVTCLRDDKRMTYKQYARWMFFWAAMVSISRIFVAKHYLGDVIVGIIVGYLAGMAFGKLARWAMKKYFA